MAIDKVTSAAITDGTITSSDLASGAVPNQSAFKNIIINGDMSIAQRATSKASITGSSYETVDRFKQEMTSGGTWTQSQSTDVPTGQGFAKSLKMDCTTANGSLSADSNLIITQKIEGQNLQYIKKGTSSAESLTASFWVKSNKTGTYTCALRDADNDRWIAQTYTISSADTWEKKTLTFAGDTTGALNNDNGTSLQFYFYLLAGTNFTSGTLNTSWGANTAANRVSSSQVNLADSTSNEWYVTGVQLEAGTSASDFEFLPFDINKNRCLRYYYVHAAGASLEIACGFYYNSGYLTCHIQFPQEMRAPPSLIKTSGTNYYRAWRANSEDLFDDFNNGIQSPTTTSCGIDGTTGVSGTQGEGNRIITVGSDSLIAFSAEL